MTCSHDGNKKGGGRRGKNEMSVRKNGDVIIKETNKIKVKLNGT